MHLLSANSRRWRDRYAFENSIRISAPCGTPFRPATRPHVAGGKGSTPGIPVRGGETKTSSRMGKAALHYDEAVESTTAWSRCCTKHRKLRRTRGGIPLSL
jgi:hypothetical protein